MTALISMLVETAANCPSWDIFYETQYMFLLYVEYLSLNILTAVSLVCPF